MVVPCLRNPASTIWCCVFSSYQCLPSGPEGWKTLMQLKAAPRRAQGGRGQREPLDPPSASLLLLPRIGLENSVISLWLLRSCVSIDLGSSDPSSSASTRLNSTAQHSKSHTALRFCTRRDECACAQRTTGYDLWQPWGLERKNAMQAKGGSCALATTSTPAWL